jgi:hypothetical protein
MNNYPLVMKLESQEQFFVKTIHKLGFIPYTLRNGYVLVFFSPITGRELTLALKGRIGDKVNYELPIKDGEVIGRIFNDHFVVGEGENRLSVPMKRVEYPFDFLLTNGQKLLEYWPYQKRDQFGGDKYEAKKISLHCPEIGCYDFMVVDVDPNKTPLNFRFTCESCFTNFVVRSGAISVGDINDLFKQDQAAVQPIGG